MFLDELEKGATGKVVAIKAEGKLKRRIFDMGITPGTLVTVKKFAPLRDPIEVSVRGYELSLRIAEAKTIEVEEVK